MLLDTMSLHGSAVEGLYESEGVPCDHNDVKAIENDFSRVRSSTRRGDDDEVRR
jgi:hypothetical protein